MNTIPKKELHELIEALPETDTIAAKRYLEFLISQGEADYFSPEDLYIDTIHYSDDSKELGD